MLNSLEFKILFCKERHHTKYLFCLIFNKGKHLVEILYGGQSIMGSPFLVEIYDPARVTVEGNRRGTVGEKLEFVGKYSLNTV